MPGNKSHRPVIVTFRGRPSPDVAGDPIRARLRREAEAAIPREPVPTIPRALIPAVDDPTRPNFADTRIAIRAASGVFDPIDPKRRIADP